MQYSGIVQKGGRRAASFGFPTVNIPLEDTKVAGVYAAKVRIGDQEYEAVAFADQSRRILEAHVLDFTADLYGWNIKIELLKKIRNRKKFKDDEALKRAIAEDITAVRQYFSS